MPDSRFLVSGEQLSRAGPRLGIAYTEGGKCTDVRTPYEPPICTSWNICRTGTSHLRGSGARTQRGDLPAPEHRSTGAPEHRSTGTPEHRNTILGDNNTPRSSPDRNERRVPHTVPGFNNTACPRGAGGLPVTASPVTEHRADRVIPRACVLMHDTVLSCIPGSPVHGRGGEITCAPSAFSNVTQGRSVVPGGTCQHQRPGPLARHLADGQLGEENPQPAGLHRLPLQKAVAHKHHLRSSKMGEILPSCVGPMFISRFPPQDTVSTNV
ncbi:hypothetical protein EYF80_011467 [Liparis tanakae]|uniref:Uncharacterized protein n=1 Tax=Liparis tanakae TaxID=230148 RepID=A0A4Z2IKB0_9TELE|nr:hypothetical protein EYF80_011467 [Liparis tanakae]